MEHLRRCSFEAGERQISAIVGEGDSNSTPLVACLHGGSYNSAYFDIPGASMLGRAVEHGFTLVAMDRLAYGGSTKLPDAELSYALNAETLADAIGSAWRELGAGRPGVVVVGHSMGGAVAMHLASRTSDWPLLGLSVSGIAEKPPEGLGDVLEVLPPGEPVVFDAEGRRRMYGPDWTIEDDVVDRASISAEPMPHAELVEIHRGWLEEAASIAANIRVPVQVGLVEFDCFWDTSPLILEAFAGRFVKAPFVDAPFIRASGHNVDHHLVGRAWHRRQFAFFDECAAEGRRPRGGIGGSPGR